ncbi:hypothetical protein GCM10027456_71270 [Kineosporia babensis]
MAANVLAGVSRPGALSRLSVAAAFPTGNPATSGGDFAGGGNLNVLGCRGVSRRLGDPGARAVETVLCFSVEGRAIKKSLVEDRTRPTDPPRAFRFPRRGRLRRGRTLRGLRLGTGGGFVRQEFAGLRALRKAQGGAGEAFGQQPVGGDVEEFTVGVDDYPGGSEQGVARTSVAGRALSALQDPQTPGKPVPGARL